jgi:hypothetical protein
VDARAARTMERTVRIQRIRLSAHAPATLALVFAIVAFGLAVGAF